MRIIRPRLQVAFYIMIYPFILCSVKYYFYFCSIISSTLFHQTPYASCRVDDLAFFLFNCVVNLLILCIICGIIFIFDITLYTYITNTDYWYLAYINCIVLLYIISNGFICVKSLNRVHDMIRSHYGASYLRYLRHSFGTQYSQLCYQFDITMTYFCDLAQWLAFIINLLCYEWG